MAQEQVQETHGHGHGHGHGHSKSTDEGAEKIRKETQEDQGDTIPEPNLPEDSNNNTNGNGKSNKLKSPSETPFFKREIAGFLAAIVR
jgi:hypothetical protein